MKEITVKNEVFKLKKDYLTNIEVNYIVSEVLKLYNQEGDIDDYRFSPLTMMSNFYSLLFQCCIEGYNFDNEEDYEKAYNCGLHKLLIENITNAEEAYKMILDISNKFNGLEYIISQALTELMKKIPDAKAMNKMINKLPKEMQEAVKQYEMITGLSTKEETE